MEEKEIRDGVKKVFLEVFGGDLENFNFGKKQEDFENWDSLAHMQLVSGVETAFSVQLEMEEIVEIQTPEGFVKLVEKKLNHKETK
ncbi:MAG TPA: acyl carrier protein [archaeon]|jgi:acyl carrier protein|nr:acyl carrier protein [archaeon]